MGFKETQSLNNLKKKLQRPLLLQNVPVNIYSVPLSYKNHTALHLIQYKDHVDLFVQEKTKKGPSRLQVIC